MPQEIALAEQVPAVIERAQALEVASFEQERQAVEFLGEIKAMKAKMEAARKELVQPLNDHVRDINNKFRPYVEQLDKARTTVDPKIIAYHRKCEEIAREEQRKLDEETMRRMEEAEANPTADEDSVLVEIPVPVVTMPGKTTHAQGASATVRKTLDFEVTSFADLPDEFKLVDEKKLRKVVQAGVKVAGVRIFEREVLAVR